MATARSAHKVRLFVLWYGVVRSRMEECVMAIAQSAHRVTLFGLVTCQCASRINFPNFETTWLMMDYIPDSKYQGYLGPQGALDSPSGSHRAHWKFRKVILKLIEVEVCILNMIHVPGPRCCTKAFLWF